MWNAHLVSNKITNLFQTDDYVAIKSDALWLILL